MDENAYFEQEYFPKTAKSNYKIGLIGILLRTWLANYDESFENINSFDLFASILKQLNEIS